MNLYVVTDSTMFWLKASGLECVNIIGLGLYSVFQKDPFCFF